MMTRYLMVLLAQLLSMMLRLIMTVPSLFSAAPGVINACTEQGVLRVAGRGLYSFGAGFCGMFSSVVPEPEANEVVSNPSAQSFVTQRRSKAEMRNFYSKRYRLPQDDEIAEQASDSLGCSC